MPKSRTKLAEIAQKTWCARGEQVVWAVNRDGHVGSTVGSTRTAPHVPVGQVPEVHVSEPEWPLPTRAVGEGRFHLDEWAHDPAIWGWAHAAHPGQAAARWADLFTAGADECWLLLSNRRLALVVESGLTQPEQPSGGLLGKVLTRSPQRPDGPPLVMWWEAPAGDARYTAAPLGREVQPRWFVRVAFPDGSRFEFRDAQAEQSVVTAYANL
ncbi:hypothetical protein [Saccharothrix variisporea]|uniref:Uncharacterized protein n=1 Tax=Saccharothrix variisporea TaxID=543527 RepID=A0A495XCK2_9PSEU|nr:hypothetical protein [Saccharothrix variisporea]RKT69268.1 hypothetical protein DFJ66_2472 [Saccharothrix variisporea]